jgi:hypothetical protein
LALEIMIHSSSPPPADQDSEISGIACLSPGLHEFLRAPRGPTASALGCLPQPPKLVNKPPNMRCYHCRNDPLPWLRCLGHIPGSSASRLGLFPIDRRLIGRLGKPSDSLHLHASRTPQSETEGPELSAMNDISTSPRRKSRLPNPSSPGPLDIYL